MQIAHFVVEALPLGSARTGTGTGAPPRICPACVGKSDHIGVRSGRTMKTKLTRFLSSSPSREGESAGRERRQHRLLDDAFRLDTLTSLM